MRDIRQNIQVTIRKTKLIITAVVFQNIGRLASRDYDTAATCVLRVEKAT